MHNYPFPSYGSLATDSTGNSYSTVSRESVMNNYNIVERKALENWGVDMLIDIFPSQDSFVKPIFAPLWSQTFPTDVTALEKDLDEIAWKYLVECVVCEPDEFDEKWNQLQEELDNAGREAAEQAVTEIIQKQAAFWQSE